MHPIQKNLVKAVQREFHRVEADIKIRPNVPEAMIKINATQNALRTSMEAVLCLCVPYDGNFLTELAIRLASYAISTAPMEDQDVLVSDFLKHFADAHMRRTAEDKVIKSHWQMLDGREQPNFPPER